MAGIDHLGQKRRGLLALVGLVLQHTHLGPELEEFGLVGGNGLLLDDLLLLVLLDLPLCSPALAACLHKICGHALTHWHGKIRLVEAWLFRSTYS